MIIILQEIIIINAGLSLSHDCAIIARGGLARVGWRIWYWIICSGRSVGLAHSGCVGCGGESGG